MPKHRKSSPVLSIVLTGRGGQGVKLSSEFKIDIDAMLAAAKGSGLVFYCNPNNPTATYVGAKATRRMLSGEGL